MYSLKESLLLTKEMEFPLGFDDNGNLRKEDLSELNHILVSGGSGFGKSNFIDSMILSLIAHNGPEKVKFVMCDTKASEFSQYADMKHLLMPIATNLREISVSLGVVLSQGQERLKEFGENRVKTISSYNDIAWELYDRELPRIVVVVDDLASVVNPPGSTRNAYSYMSERLDGILSIGRSAGIHLIAATQTPTKKNMRGVSSQFLSKLLFYLPSRADMRFLVGAETQDLKSEPGEALFCNGEESEIVHTLLIKPSDFSGIEVEPDVDLIDRAAEIAIEEGVVNEATLQGRLGISKKLAYNTLTQLEEIGLIGPKNDFGNRGVLISKELWEKAVEQLEDE